MARINPTTIAEKINYIKICYLVIEYSISKISELSEKKENLDNQKDKLDKKIFNKEKRGLKANIVKNENLKKYYSDIKTKISIELSHDDKFVKYKAYLLDKFTL